MLSSAYISVHYLLRVLYFTLYYNCTAVPVSVAGIATAYGLDGPGIESWWGARFSAPVPTGPEAHPASRKMGTGSFPGLVAAGA